MIALAQVGMPGVPYFSGYVSGIVFVGMIVLFLVDLAFAIAVGADANRRIQQQQPLAFVGPGVWFLATWIGSFFVVALYWLLHYSTLRHPTEFPERS